MNPQPIVYPLPHGFMCSGITSGIKEDRSRKDLGLIVCERNALLGAVYTQNRFPSAHVSYCKPLTPSNRFRALVVNSGNANAATGQTGQQSNLQMAESVAEKLGVNQDQVFTSSTGIIGHRFPIEIIDASLDRLIAGLSADCSDVAEAILTTDLKTKLATETVDIDSQKYTVTGFAKGSGMIHPHMATMLAYILTDAPLPYPDIQQLTADIVNRSFNCISVDGDTSTNDSFYLISSNPINSMDQPGWIQVGEAIEKVAVSLAKQIAADGEGANHLIEAVVKGAPDETTGREVLHAILTSNLVKTAIHGKDPNWGRLLMAVGNGLASSAVRQAIQLSIRIQGVPVFTAGEPVEFNEPALAKSMDAATVKIEVDLRAGAHTLTGWGCDLSNEYVHINADYTT